MKRRVLVGVNRALAFVHRQVARADRLLPEIALALLDDPDVERAGLLENYGPGTPYVTLENQAIGLYPFEARALEAHFPKPPARLLLPGAGAGRELFALREMEYEVDAFDPAPALVAAACARGGANAVRLGDVATWARETAHAPPIYDGIFTGWTLWTHLVRRSERIEALKAFRRACPRGPVLLSFWRREKVFDLEEEVLEHTPDAHWRGVLGQIRSALHDEATNEPGTGWRSGMFVHLVHERELASEAEACGYRVVAYERDGSRFPNAVLVPV